MSHPDFAVLTVSWELALRADGYADNTVKAYQKAVRSLADWLAERHPQVGPVELDRRHIRGWLVDVRESHSSTTPRGWFAGVRHFCRWLQSEGETDQDATAGIRTPAPGDPETEVLSDEDLRRLLASCAGTDFTARWDTAIIMLFLDGGLRLSELAGLQVADVQTVRRHWPPAAGQEHGPPGRQPEEVRSRGLPAVMKGTQLPYAPTLIGTSPTIPKLAPEPLSQDVTTPQSRLKVSRCVVTKRLGRLEDQTSDSK